MTNSKTGSTSRVSTGVEGLDDILEGGLPEGQMYLLEGDPGTGKTTVAMQFLFKAVAEGKKVLYVTLSESKAELASSAESHGWNFDLIPVVEFVPDEASLSAEQQYTVFHPTEVELATTITRMTEQIEAAQPACLVIDSLSELRLLASDNMRYRRQLLALKQFFSGRKATVLLLDDRTADGHDLQLQSIAHGVIRLEKLSRSFGITRRRIEVIKLRGSTFREGFHDYSILHQGVTVFPRLVASEHSTRFDGEQIQSGIEHLDTLFGGGIPRGSSTLIIGPTGSGKSSVSMQYAYAAAKRGDRAIIYAFDEVLKTALARAEGLGMDVQPEIDRGTLCVTQVDPAELSPGEFVWQIRNDVNNKDTRVVVIDSLNGFLNSMPGESDLFLHMHELLSYLNQKGVVTILVMTQHGLIGTMSAQVDVSYLADTVLLLRYFEALGRIRQSIAVLKKRIGNHERTLRELTLRPGAIEVGETLTEFQGVLTGVPQFVGNDQTLKQRRTLRMALRNTVVVHAPIGRDAELIVQSLKAAGASAASMPSLEDLVEIAKSGRAGALLLTAEAISPTSLQALSEALTHQPEWSDLPVLILVPGGRESSVIDHMERTLAPIPNLTFLERPIRPVTLASVARNALRSRYRQYEVQRIIEEREQAATAMIQSEKLAAVGRLASTIAHEINNPLEAVTNLLYLVRTDPSLSQSARDYMDTADRELARVAQIASQTLRFHRQATAATSVRPEALLDEVLGIYKSRLANSDVTISREFEAGAQVVCYEGDIRQVLSNLVGNAFDVMRKGGKLRLRTRKATWWETGVEGVLFTVCDDGPGMSEHTRHHIFDAFYSTKGIHGTGLGLWISKRIVHKHRGHLTVRSSMGPSHGTVFHLWLPANLATSAADAWHTEELRD